MSTLEEIKVPESIKQAIAQLNPSARGELVLAGQVEPYEPGTPFDFTKYDRDERDALSGINTWYAWLWYERPLQFRKVAVAILVDYFPTEFFVNVPKQIEEDPDLLIKGHMGSGMHVRNVLRTYGLRDNYLPTGNWDDYWKQAVEYAVLGEVTGGENLTDEMIAMAGSGVLDRPDWRQAFTTGEPPELTWYQRLRNRLFFSLGLGGIKREEIPGEKRPWWRGLGRTRTKR